MFFLRVDHFTFQKEGKTLLTELLLLKAYQFPLKQSLLLFLSLLLFKVHV